MKKILGIIAAILLIGVLFSCGDTGPAPTPEPVEEEIAEAITETEDLEPVETPEFEQGMITFFSGEVFILEEEEWWEVAIGDMLEKDDVLKTEAASYCEIQFGDTALVRVQENTEIAIRNVALTPGEANVNVGMKEGSVLAKVKKLSGDDSCKVQTQTAVCGVRGTEFAVTADRAKGTNLAVKEGSVAVLPSSVDVDKLKEKVGKDNEELVKIIEDLENSASVVEANQEIDVDEDAMKETKEAAKLIEAVVEEIVQEAIAEQSQEQEGETLEEQQPVQIRKVDPAKLANLQKAIAQTKVEVASRVAQPKEISTENTEKLQEIDRMKMLALSVRPVAAEKGEEEETSAENASEEAPVEAVPKLLKISLSIEPKEAQISLNGDFLGKGKFSGIFTEGEELSFVVSSEGYKDHVLELTASEETGKLYKIQLAKVPKTEKVEKEAKGSPEEESVEEPTVVAEKEEPKAEAEEKKPEPVAMEKEKAEPKIVTSNVRIQVQPRDAAIFLNGTQAGTGTFNKQYQEGTQLTFTFQRNGYNPGNLALTVGRQNINRTITLTAKTIQYDIPVSNGALVGRMMNSGNLVFTADSGGMVTALGLEGKKVWNIATANSPNENSYPVIINGTLFFSGSKELVIANSVNGTVQARVPLDAPAAHLFGRRVVPSNSGLLLPTNESIRIINQATGATIKEIPLPKGSRMTPAVWNNKIVIADQQGSLLIINPNGKNPIEAEISTAAVQPVALAPSISGNKAIYSGRKGTVVCVDLQSKEVLWEKKLSGNASVFTDIACSGNGVYAFAKGSIYALNLQNGADLFAPISGATSPALCTGTNVVYGAGNQLVIRNGSSGAIVQNIALPAGVTTVPVQVGDNIIVGTENGRVLYIHP